MHGPQNFKGRFTIYLFIHKHNFRLRLPSGAGGYPPKVLQPTEAYCTTPL
jgi:hypothetical protein